MGPWEQGGEGEAGTHGTSLWLCACRVHIDLLGPTAPRVSLSQSHRAAGWPDHFYCSGACPLSYLLAALESYVNGGLM